MRTNYDKFAVRISVAAVQGALLAMGVVPNAFADDDIAELTKPTSTIEAGVTVTNPVTEENRGNTTNGNNTSFKGGEYNGLQKRGVTPLMNFDLRGGGSFDSNDATRWRATGTDLGLDTRNLTLEYSDQGNFKFNLGYDELSRNRSDTYQTPYRGAGSNSLTLPSNWLVPTVPQNSNTGINDRSLGPAATAYAPAVYNAAGNPVALTANQITAINAIRAADLPAFQNVNVGTKRTKIDGGFMITLDPQWNLVATAQHEKKDGMQLMGTVSRVAPTTGGSVSDTSAIIPYLINQDTNQVNLGINYKGDKGFAQAAYYGSFFKNNVGSMSWQNWQTGGWASGATGLVNAGAFTTTTESTAPSNQFHQLSLTGGYNFDKTTRLVANASYGRNTQNQSFLSDASTVVVPQSSLNGLVVTKNLGLKLTARPVQDLNVTAGYKYDLRDNRTPVNTYQYSDVNEAVSATNARLVAGGTVNPWPGLLFAQNANANRPYSKKVNQANFEADYAFTKGQAVKAGYDYQKTDRWCNGTWIDCMDAATTKDNTLRVEYRNTMVENLTGRANFAYSERRISNYNENAFLALVPFANVPIAGLGGMSAYQALLLSGLNGYGPLAGWNGGVFAGTGLTPAQAAAFFGTFNAAGQTAANNALSNALYANNNRISELPGMRRYNMSDRDRDRLRGSLNWQATEQLVLQGGVDTVNDKYTKSVYGLQKGSGWSANFDATYTANEDWTFAAFYTYEDQKTRSAGNNYATNNSGTVVGATNNNDVNGQTAIVGGCFATIAARNQSNKIDPCENWTVNSHDQVDTLGFNTKHKGLAGGKLEMGGDLIFTRARTSYGATGGVYVNNPFAVAGVAANTIPAAFYVPATSLPDVKTNSIELRINGKYALDKQSAIRVGYSYQRLKTTDYAYDGMQFGSVTTVLPTSEQAPNYTTQSVAVAYIYSFK